MEKKNETRKTNQMLIRRQREFQAWTREFDLGRQLQKAESQLTGIRQISF